MEKMKVYTCFPGGKAKALTMSYDDGKLQDKRLIGIFNKYGIKATFNLNYGQVGERPRMTFEEMEGLYDGHEIATHTMTHPTIERCPLVEVAEELLEDRKGLEKWTAGSSEDMHIPTVLTVKRSNSCTVSWAWLMPEW